MKNILIPIDFKFNSYDAIDYAVNFFKREDCQFYFLNTYTFNVENLNPIPFIQAEDVYFERPRRDSECSLRRAVQKYSLNSKNKKHHFHAVSEFTNLIEGIKKTIQELKIDLVILPGKKQIPADYDGYSYSKNTRRIIENIRECPVMIIPATAHVQKHPKFVLASNFEEDLPVSELNHWYELVEIARGSVQIVALRGKEKMHQIQIENQAKVRSHIEKLSKSHVPIENIESVADLKNFARSNSDSIICLIDKKPDFWRKFGLTHSRITDLGPLQNIPLIALHQ
ncbi:universal stress protein [Gramella sp. AN32]|uniref:Universal stress protein n=1 Tax=Christiangramia antarctica TaxID=2058158 RepID=A0ABW5X3U2_9FLAO|nr:universal stress protein [Gramella sp. AN32]MCM4155723.1 hypothetical protein [Gramella sp. AN32]